MANELQALSWTALALGIGHTALGPDHYFPFVAMSRVGGWSLRKTVGITVLSGIAHVASSVVIGIVGIWLGLLMFNMESLESIRGDLAAWMFIAFGVIYTMWGVVHAIRFEPKRTSFDPTASAMRGRMTPLVLVVIFLFGPCEPLIPYLMYPAALGSARGGLVSLLFGIATVGTMTAFVVAMYLGIGLIRPSMAWDRYSHLFAGLVVTACGVAIVAGL